MDKIRLMKFTNGVGLREVYGTEFLDIERGDDICDEGGAGYGWGSGDGWGFDDDSGVGSGHGNGYYADAEGMVSGCGTGAGHGSGVIDINFEFIEGYGIGDDARPWSWGNTHG